MSEPSNSNEPNKSPDVTATDASEPVVQEKKRGYWSKEGRNKDVPAYKKRNISRKDDEGWEDTEPHLGSFANSAMQTLHGVTVKHHDDNENDDDKNSAVVKFPKRRIALLIAFQGTPYTGMQINKDQRTIQAEIELALYNANLLSKANFGFPKKYGWSNSARTDKGVHSCAQVCSAKIQSPRDDFDEIRRDINAKLPEDIRVLDVVKTTRNFCARTNRDKVRYQYMFPSFLLLPREELVELFESIGSPTNGRSLRDPLSNEDILKVKDKLKKYRVTTDKLDKLKEVLSTFEGTKSYHNYTNKKSSDDASSKRYILSFKVDSIILTDDNNDEWISTQVVGQSFLLHQIRKMMCMAIDVTRGATDSEAMKDSFNKRNMILSIAPAHGLFLDMSFFDLYNKRNPKCQLNWASNTGSEVYQRWQEFKQDKVMKFVMEEEDRQDNFVKYLFLQEFHFDRKNYLPLDTDKDVKDVTEEKKKTDVEEVEK